MKTKLLLIAWLALSLFIACEQINEPERISRGDYPGAPTHLVAEVGDRSVHLSWNAPAGKITLYYLFRQDSTTLGWMNIDSCVATSYSDEDLLNGKQYSYRVTACNESGLQGELSDPVSARPGLYSVIINDGAFYTNSTTIALRFIAPGGTRYVKIALDSLFTQATWQLYSENISWSLMPGDGQKMVYAIFLDSQGNQTGSPVFDDIHLDTRSTIYSLALRGKESVYRTGDIIGIMMRTDELYGNASVNLGEVLGTVRLYDDGSHGDVTANDGVYCHDYLLPPCKDIFAVAITGAFTDFAGNAADEYVSSQTLTIENPPQAVELLEPVRISARDDALHLTWTVNRDADFSLYKLFRSETPKVDSSSIMVAAFELATLNHCIDSLLVHDHEYYYRIYVSDQRGLMSGSNIVSGRTTVDANPQAALLQTPLNVTTSSILMSWNQNNEADFADYRLFRGMHAAVSASDVQVALISSRSTTQFQDSGLEANTTYWYRLYTYDKAGHLSASNIISATTLPDEKPEAVLLAAPAASASGSLRLTWSVSRSAHFASYRIFRSTTQIVDGTGTPIVIINNVNTTTHDDVGLASNTSYYYRVFVYDLEERSTGSNLVYGTTLP
jgi:fibronectin type 3 domain-containing protein